MRVEQQGAYASELLHSEKLAHLSSTDHGLATQITLGVLRWRSVLDEDLARASSKKLAQLDLEVLTALRMAVFQMRYLERIPARAAIFESVELVKRARKTSAAAFVNAVLRKVQAGRDQLSIEDAADVDALAVAAAHPVWLVERWTAHYGFERARKICAYDQNIPATAIHLYNEAVQAELLQEGVKLAPGDWERLLTWMDTYAQILGQFDEAQERELKELRKTWDQLMSSGLANHQASKSSTP